MSDGCKTIELIVAVIILSTFYSQWSAMTIGNSESRHALGRMGGGCVMYVDRVSRTGLEGAGCLDVAETVYS